MELNEASKESIFLATGITYEDLIDMDFEEIDKTISKKIGKKIQYMKPKDTRLFGRGQVYFTLGRLLNKDKIDKKISKI